MHTVIWLTMPAALVALAVGILIQLDLNPLSWGVLADLPSAAQIIDQKAFNALSIVPPPLHANALTVFLWPGVTQESLTARPFHIYDKEFYDIIGPNPSLTLIATSETDPIFHEAVVWYPPSDEVFFVQNAGARAAGTGLAKSSIIQKISLAEAEAVRTSSNQKDEVTVTVVPSNPQVINPNGGTNYKNQVIFAGEGQGPDVPSALYLMNPQEPYNTTVLLNNYFGRQFNSLNDVVVHSGNGDIYFTDTLYGFLQDFRPAPGLRNQVYRLSLATGAVTVVADDFTLPNGKSQFEDGYRFDVKKDGTWENRKTFAYVAAGIPDGIHCDSKGNVYAGCADGVHVWNPSGKLIGKIYTGTKAANFQFAGQGRMIITGQTKLFYVTLAASGAALT
ncbi:hypothetical protein G7Z17_g10768 [Cylindrodendrum hubeiense]|uniref:SMP-30/Gluconolactonase/LRE-like region domain-containing protein n=1 Tax=Cylindrodendrum hubeiense TaxID=595255 RepID=A0A9P5H5B8_9HYPO|nr:hypothetical protein G7Z17_g10768 [Cylindrodendrum hubeiense]